MRNLHQILLASEFKDRYRALKDKLPRIKHLIHGGVENFYAGLENEHLLSSGIKNRTNYQSIERTLTNIELGMTRVMGLDMVEDELYIHCHPRPTQGEKAREAVWQFDVFADYIPVAAVGMNFHKEDEQIVATISNIQGHNSEGMIVLRKICAPNPWPVKSVGLILEYLPNDVKIVRGVSSSSHPFAGCSGFDLQSASNLYDRTFKKLGMQAIRNSQGKVNYYQLNR